MLLFLFIAAASTSNTVVLGPLPITEVDQAVLDEKEKLLACGPGTAQLKYTINREGKVLPIKTSSAFAACLAEVVEELCFRATGKFSIVAQKLKVEPSET